MSGKFKFAIDRGGTFTDIFAICPNGKVRVMKLLSEDPDRYEDAPTEGIKRILTQETGQVYGPGDVINESCLEWIRMGTTVATNALLERKGERMALAITQGFKDVLYIGNQSRPDIFSLDVKCPDVLYESVIEVQERAIIDFDYHEELIPCPKTGALNMMVAIEIPLDTEKLKHDLRKVYSKGIRSLAVVLAHSYSFDTHEQQVGKIAKEIGFQHVSLSSEVMPMIRFVPRGQTTCVDAYLTPCIKRYIENFTSGFEKELKDVELLFMQSDGGLTPVSSFCGSRALLSGPAGGVVGYSMTAYEKFDKSPVIGFDMGGTSTDVSRFDGNYEHVYDTAVAGVSIQAPQLDIQTVAAGGGSMLFFRSGLLVVGPESAGANPGPVCYRKGGPLTITDANLCLGRLQPDYFPKIFGPTNNLSLDKESAWKQMELLAEEVNVFINPEKEGMRNMLSVEELALGFIAVANEAMCRPIRLLTQGKGFNPSNHLLACFGGAGSQHACSIAKALGLSTVFIHRYAGILSAYGMALAQVVEEIQEAFNISFTSANIPNIDRRISQLADICMEKLKQHGFQRENVLFETYLNMRYEGSNCAVMCSSTPIVKRPPNCQDADYEKIFVNKYEREFGFRMENRAIIVEDLRIRAIGQHSLEINTAIPRMTEPPCPQTVVKCYFEGGYQATPIYLMKDLLYGHAVTGPSLIIDDNCTILVEPYCSASVTEDGSILIKIEGSDAKKITTELNVIHLSVFSHRFMSIAEQMGRVIQRTAVSTNIKERLDFSCALFGPDGGLVSNAPHIPVHLGSMQEAVRFQIHNLGADIKEGDVILSNHPCAGGSHLPDLTVITPVFIPGEEKPIFFVASRGHHADIGGLTPGSMPSNSKSLMEEGARFISFKLVDKGVFQEKALIEILDEPANYPGCKGGRNKKDNLSDLKAQVAANKKGINLVKELTEAYGLDVVQAYMYHIQNNAETTVKDMLKQLSQQKLENWCGTLQASDHMDDGTIIQLLVEVNVHEGTAVFDFTGTGIEVYGNWNTPKAVVLSAIIYCLRCMVGHDIPLNQGCLNPIKIVIPEGCILFPSHTAAVVGGNVLTSQRVVDVIFKAFGVCAASQGCMNNITFGDGMVSYYETIAGGAGAGPSWNGRSGIHTHMTNTRITDLEILEQRYPVFLKKFELRSGSGGSGIFKGGDGIIRELMFRKPMTLSVLTERRVFAPYGLEGGACGKKGVNHLIDDKGKAINLGSKASVKVDKGYRLHIETPGGGGFGDPTKICETRK